MHDPTIKSQSFLPSGMDTGSLISLMTSAYTQGMKAGHMSAHMKDNQEFADEAARLFANGLRDVLTGTVWSGTAWPGTAGGQAAPAARSKD